MKKEDVFLSLGANIDNPKKNIETAIEKLKTNKSLEVFLVSKFYKTTPVDYLSQPEFINCIAWIKTSLDVHKLHKITKKIEEDIGTDKTIKDGPRRIDIDIILYGDLVILTSDLQIPHPKMHERRFVLVPLVEINSDLIHPEFNQTVQELLDNLPETPLQSVKELI